jgi:hypothetical protein
MGTAGPWALPLGGAHRGMMGPLDVVAVAVAYDGDGAGPLAVHLV